MDVLITFGRYAGQIRDIEPSAALAMLKDGRAKRPGEELDPEMGDIYQINPDFVRDVEGRVFAPEEIAAPAAVRPEELVEVQSRRRSRR